MKVVLEKRLEQSLKAQIGLPVLSALMALTRFWYMRACSAARWATITAFRKLL